jgi:hypothetical protein
MTNTQLLATDQAAVTAATTQQTTDQAALVAAEALVSTDQAAVNADAVTLAADEAQLTSDTAAATPAPTVLSVLTELEASASTDNTISASILTLIQQALSLAQVSVASTLPAPM